MKKVIVLVFMVAFLAGCGRNYSNGSRVGVVTKLSEKGVIWKSWEGELNLGGVRQGTDANGNSSVVPNIFEFNADPSVVSKLQEAMRTGKRVELVYRQWLIAPLSISNDHVIIEVKTLD